MTSTRGRAQWTAYTADVNPCPVAQALRASSACPGPRTASTIHRCTACGTAWAFPRPTEQDLADFYGAAYFTADTGFGYGDYDGASWAGVQAVRAWDELHEWAPENEDVASRRLLDVGAATGEFALRAQRGGLGGGGLRGGDTAREAARAKGLTAVATIDEAPGHFGMISMYHVLEHLIDPLAVLRLARAAVASDGYLVIELPQWHSAGRIVRRSPGRSSARPSTSTSSPAEPRDDPRPRGLGGGAQLDALPPRRCAGPGCRASRPRARGGRAVREVGARPRSASAATCAPSPAPPEPARRHTQMRPASRGMSRNLVASAAALLRLASVPAADRALSQLSLSQEGG